MKVKLDKNKLLEEMYSEEELSELSISEAIYQIRTLMAIIHYGTDSIEVPVLNIYGQAFIEKFNIYCYCLPVTD